MPLWHPKIFFWGDGVLLMMLHSSLSAVWCDSEQKTFGGFCILSQTFFIIVVVVAEKCLTEKHLLQFCFINPAAARIITTKFTHYDKK